MDLLALLPTKVRVECARVDNRVHKNGYYVGYIYGVIYDQNRIFRVEIIEYKKI
jgi:hypothetical protein